MEIRLTLDKPDRTYQMGEEISGTIELDPAQESDELQVWITYRWRTHGRGTPDHGGESRLDLADKGSLRDRLRRSRLDFRFRAPHGPPTYHGEYLNVDWYLTAHVRRGIAPPQKKEEDFILMPDRPPLQAFRFESPGRPIAADASTVPPRQRFYDVVTTLGGGMVVLVWIVLQFRLWRYLPGDNVTPWVLGAVGAGLLLVLALVIYSGAYKRKLEIRRLEVEPKTARPGSDLRCILDFVARREVVLQTITATLYAQEMVTRQQGTSSVTETQIVSVKTVEKRYQQHLNEGQVIAFHSTLPLNETAPASFSSAANKLEWYVRVEIGLKSWPGFSKTFPITVLP